MASVLEMDIRYRVGTFDLSVRLSVGAEILVLFGPSGAGKTLTLHAVAGLIRPHRGHIFCRGQPWFMREPGRAAVWIPARRRRVGLVFQEYALFPHMTARENVLFGMRGERRQARAEQLLQKMHLAHLADHYPDMLSGGQKQRVALARALAMEPAILCLDEPFASLDNALRERLLDEIRTIHEDHALPILYVTHQLAEATRIGHRLTLMDRGRIIQCGPVHEVLRRPANHRAAQMLGMRNLIRARVERVNAAGVTLNWQGLRLEAAPQDLPSGAEVCAYVQPDDIKILYPNRPIPARVLVNRFPARILSLHPGPEFVRAQLQVGPHTEHRLEMRFPRSAYLPLRLAPGKEVEIAIRRDRIGLFPLDDTEPTPRSTDRPGAFHSPIPR